MLSITAEAAEGCVTAGQILNVEGKLRLDGPEEARDSAKAVRLATLFLTLFVLSSPRLALALDAGRSPVKISHLDASAAATIAVADAATAPDEDVAVPEARPAETASASPLPVASAAASVAPPISEPDAGDTKEEKDQSSPAEVKVHDHVVFLVRVPAGALTIEARAKAANAALDSIHPEHGQPPPDTRIETTGDSAVVYVGTTPIFTVGRDDAAASGDPSVAVAAEKISAAVHDTLRTEQKRAAVADAVYAFSLLVFSGLIAFLLFRQTNALLNRARNYFREHPGFLTGLRLGNIEVLSRATTRGAVAIALSVAHRLLQVSIAYVWLVFGLSLFETTRPLTERLTGFVFRPITALLERVGSTLPVLVVAAFAIIAVGILVRFVGLFFEAVERGETKLDWLPADLSRTTSILLRGAIIVTALVLGSPLVTGTDDGPLPRVGLVTILVLGVSAVPLLSSAVVGAVVVFARAVKVGDYVEWGGHVGRVKATSLLSLHLEDEAGCDLFVPHLLSLVHPTRVLGHAPLETIDVVVDAMVSQSRAHQVLVAAVKPFRGRVALVRIDGAGTHYRVTASDADENGTNLVKSLSEALEKNNITISKNAFEVRPSGPSLDDQT
ncbi:MAG: mechanosensitive ion channel domain-containing protein [Polyangiaceae bacterium]